MSKTKKNFAEIISNTQVMAQGLKSQQTEVAKRGIDAQFISELEKLREEAINLNAEQERLKAELKMKTESLNNKMDTLYAKLSEAKKVVKLAIPQAGWLEFGITDKR